MNIEEILDKLLSGVHTVVFKKVSDNTVRKMKCTLINENIKDADRRDIITKVKDKKVLSVWDTEKNAWRSFRIDNVIRFEENENDEE